MTAWKYQCWGSDRQRGVGEEAATDREVEKRQRQPEKCRRRGSERQRSVGEHCDRTEKSIVIEADTDRESKNTVTAGEIGGERDRDRSRDIE